MKAIASSSSATNRSEPNLFEVDLVASGRLPPLPTAFLNSKDLDLLQPLRFLSPGELPGDPSPTDRRALAAALETVNLSYGVSRAAELAAKLADPETCVVVTGQQPGILGGPLLSLSKMVAGVAYAEALEAAGRKAVAVYWVATEDHDWDEIGRTTFLGTKPEQLILGEDREPLKPIGDRVLGPGIESILERLQALTPGGPAEQRLATVRECYGPQASFGEAFCRLMAAVLGDRAPLFLDSQLPALKQAQKPYLRTLIEQRFELDRAYQEVEKLLEARGYTPQVTPQPGVSPLFLVHQQERRRIEWRGEATYGLRGLDDYEAPVSELLALLEENPSCISPGVLARPAIQDVVLGSSLQLMGPSELSYMTQARAAYRILGIDRTWTTLRPQVLAIDRRQADRLEELQLPLEELFDSNVQSIVADRFGDDFVTPIRERLLAILAELEEPVLELDKSLEKPLQKTRDQIVRGLDNFTARVEAAVTRTHETWARRVEQLSYALQPDGLQERSLSTAWLWVRYGPELVDAIFSSMRLESRKLDVVFWGRE